MQNGEKITTAARDRMRLWLGTMSKRDELRENPDAMNLQISLLEEALLNVGANIDAKVDAIFHTIKTKRGLIYWPSPKDVVDVAVELKRGASTGSVETGDRSALSFDQQEILETRVLPNARKMLDNPALKIHGVRTLEYWGMPAE